MHPVEDAAVSVYSVYSNSRKLPEPSIACINYARFFRRNHTMSTFLRPLYETYMALPVCKNIFDPEEIGCCHLQAWPFCLRRNVYRQLSQYRHQPHPAIGPSLFTASMRRPPSVSPTSAPSSGPRSDARVRRRHWPPRAVPL